MATLHHSDSIACPRMVVDGSSECAVTERAAACHYGDVDEPCVASLVDGHVVAAATVAAAIVTCSTTVLAAAAIVVVVAGTAAAPAAAIDHVGEFRRGRSRKT